MGATIAAARSLAWPCRTLAQGAPASASRRGAGAATAQGPASNPPLRRGGLPPSRPRWVQPQPVAAATAAGVRQRSSYGGGKAWWGKFFPAGPPARCTSWRQPLAATAAAATVPPSRRASQGQREPEEPVTPALSTPRGRRRSASPSIGRGQQEPPTALRAPGSRRAAATSDALSAAVQQPQPQPLSPPRPTRPCR